MGTVKKKDVPPETGLLDAKFDKNSNDDPTVYSTPTDATGSWKKPGPVAGPYQTRLSDGSTLTYYWYRFADQPALLNAGLSYGERQEMQKRVEKLHRSWTKEREYLPPPSTGKLVDLDPGIIVQPPTGYEIGYVPIATGQSISTIK